MNISKLLLAGCLTGMSFISASAQPLSSSEQDKAIELLRQKIAEERAKPANRQAPNAAMPEVTNGQNRSSAGAPAAPPADPASYQNALDALRESLASSRQATKATPAPAPAPAPAPSAPAPMAHSETGENALNAVRAALSAQRQVVAKPVPAAPRVEAPRAAVTAPAKADARPEVSAPAAQSVVAVVAPQPSGPKSKQQRLMELLQLYRTDQVTPLEYHGQRATIIAEP